MKPALELAITPKLHKDHLVERQADQIQRLGDRGSGHVLRVGHGGRERWRERKQGQSRVECRDGAAGRKHGPGNSSSRCWLVSAKTDRAKTWNAGK
jgi:hypothetical protein